MSHEQGVRPHDAPSSHRPKTLTDLPRELRDQIYEYATVSEYALPALATKIQQRLIPGGVKYALCVPSLACVCRALRQEVLQVYISHNTFDVYAGCYGLLDSAAGIKIWRKLLGPLVKHVRTIAFEMVLLHAHGWSEKHDFNTYLTMSLLDVRAFKWTSCCHAPGVAMSAGPHCVCDFSRGLSDRVAGASESKGDSLLNFAKEILSNEGEKVEEFYCGRCGLVGFVPVAYAKPLWP